MATTTKTWVFAADNEGLADAGNSAIAAAYTGADGNPAGCLAFTMATVNDTLTEYARKAATGETWADWGVPADQIVTHVQITAWDEKLADNTRISSHNLKARVIGSGGATVHSAGDLLDVALGTSVDASWEAGAAGSQRAVDAGSQALATDVRLEIEYSCTTGVGSGPSVIQRLDNIELTITYEAAPEDTAASNLMLLGVG